MKSNKIIVVVIVGIILLASSPFALGLIWPRINDVYTGATPEYADLQPQRFGSTTPGYDRVFDAALAVANEMKWAVREADKAQGVIEAVATTRLFHFQDDVTVRVTREGEQVIVNTRSKSRIGKGDLGTNARRIREFQTRLAAKL